MQQSSPTPGPPREWMPHIWEGCDSFAWLHLLATNHFAVQPSYWYVAAIVTVVSMGHTFLRAIQDICYGSKITRTKITEHPLFILGHWRTGTTLLHELLILDPKHNYPSTYECMEPNHFLLTQDLVRRYLKFLAPSSRQVDNMAAGWERPQEDEFALCMMGLPSPYRTLAFPNHLPQGRESLELQQLTPEQRRRWERGFLRFLRTLTCKDGRRLVLKSPTHTWRIPTLLSLFPDARFVHIIRNPYAVFPSTINLWKTLYETQGLQQPHFQGLEEHVLTTFTWLYERLEQTRDLIPSRRFYELRYENLIADPVGELERLYDHLELAEFEQVRPRIEQFFHENANYQTNRYARLSAEAQTKITQRWASVIQRYGYSEPEQRRDQG